MTTDYGITGYGKKIAEAGLAIGAIKLRPEDPFTWASGFRMPIYNDNRMFLFDSGNRALILLGFEKLTELDDVEFDVIAGTSTAGIPHAAGLANNMRRPMIYVRDKPKDHGLKNRIEGLDTDKDLEGKRVLLIEDLISTGGSSASAVQGVRDANGNCIDCYSIFSYGLDKAEAMFRGEEPFNKEDNKLNPPCTVKSLLTYDVLLEVAKDLRILNADHINMLDEWRADPFNWGANHGFPKVEKK
jgi:orotate phosphoribosyltransferase